MTLVLGGDYMRKFGSLEFDWKNGRIFQDRTGSNQTYGFEEETTVKKWHL